MRIHICGSRGSTPAPGVQFARYGGHTSCVALAHDGQRPSLLIDAGTGIRDVSSLLDGHPFDGAILLSHLHWDHTQGLPFFRGGDDPDARATLYLPEQGEDPLHVLARGFSPPHFPIRPDQLHGRWEFLGMKEGEHKIEGFHVMAREIPHKGGRTFGFRVSDETGTIAYLSDHHPATLGAGPDGFGVYHEAACTLAAEADLLLHDAQYLPDEWPQRAHFGHSTVSYAVGLAEAAQARALLLFHHDPARTDAEITELTTRAQQGAAVGVQAAADGQTFDIGGDER
jgi:phosphoribosyl 1,2-cyclic phosphodiesterase